MEVSFQWNKEESVHLEFGNLKYASIRMQQFDKWKKWFITGKEIIFYKQLL